MNRKIILILFIVFLSCFIGCKSEEIGKLDQEIKVLTEEKKDLEEENETLKDEKKLLEDEKEALEEEKEALELEKEELKNEILKLQNKLSELINENQNNETKIDSLVIDKEALINEVEKLLNSEILEKEWLNVLYDIMSSGLSLEKYIEFKENNSMINRDSNLKELFDKIYYYYNSNNSISFLNELAEYDDMKLRQTGLLSTGNDIVFKKTNQNGYNIILFRIRFFETTQHKEVFLDNIKDFEQREYLYGKNFCLLLTGDFGQMINENEISEIGVYINELLLSDSFVNKEECYEKFLDIKDTNNYLIDISSNDAVIASSEFVIGTDDKVLFNICFLRSEYDVNTIEDMYTTLIFNDDLREKIFSKYYLFGRIAVIPNLTYIDILENTETYKYVLENGINAYDYYLNNK